MSVIDDFRRLHESGTFVMPNPWDVGSAALLERLGFPALATTSSGHAASIAKRDHQVTRDELLEHVATVAAAVAIPLSVDAERCFAETPEGVAETVSMLAESGAAGCSIEDYDPATSKPDDLGEATERVAAAAEVARRTGFVLTARCENLLYGVGDLDQVITRLLAYRNAGADVVYAPGPTDLDVIRRLAEGVDAPLNVLARPTGPSVAQLGSVGVRRVSTGGSLARAAYAAMMAGARELLTDGTSSYTAAVTPETDPFRALA